MEGWSLRDSWPVWGAFVVAVTALLGSLYFSQIRHFTPCTLCWAQRIAMYPLTPVLGFMLITRNRALAYLVLLGSLLGQGISTYHYLLQKTTLLTAADTCGGGVPCGLIYIDWWGIVTIPLLAMCAFMLVTVGMAVYLVQPAPVHQGVDTVDGQAVQLVAGIALLGAIIWIAVYFGARSVPAVEPVPAVSVPALAPSPDLPLASDPAEPGRLLFGDHCAACHGRDGVGIPGLTPSLQTSEWVRDLSSQQLATLILQGVSQDDPQNRTGNLMPPSGGTELNDSELQAVVDFLKSQVVP